MSRVSIPDVHCKVRIETTSLGSCTSSSNSCFENAILSLGRNQFRDLVLSIQDSKSSKIWTFELCSNTNNAPIKSYKVKVHGNFIKDGKSSLILISEILKKKIQIMISNAAPSTLSLFVNSIQVKKVANQENVSQVTLKDRLTTMKRPLFDKVSPVTVHEVKKVRKVLSDLNSSPKSSKSGSQNVQNRNKKVQNEPLILGRGFKRSPSFKNMTKVPNLEFFFPKIELTREQQAIVSSVLSGNSIFFSGSAGSGKTFLLKHLRSLLPPDTTAMTASTGLAASHIQGMTLHTFAGIGAGNLELEECIKVINSNVSKKNLWKRTKVLIIDEVSMVDCDFLDKLESISRIIRNQNCPFGGIQLILCGDFFQLPPVRKLNSPRTFCFNSNCWAECINETFILSHVKRQSDLKFVQLLEKIRFGICDEQVVQELKKSSKHKFDESSGMTAVKLCTHKNDVEVINQRSLDTLTSPEVIFKAADSNVKFSLALDSYCPSPRILKLKIGAQIILSKNLDLSKGLVNGSRGKIINFEPISSSSLQMLPVIRFTNGIEQVIKPETWRMKTSGSDEFQWRKQLPLNLGWALSIHKSQGMEIDQAEISLARVFEPGQAYVALSRVRTFSGLKVTDFNSDSISADSQVINFYKNL